MFTPEMKKATATVVRDSDTKMSTRVLSALYYLAIRACEIIDWWFPTEYEKLQRKRTKACLNDSAPKGATIEIDPKTGVAMGEKYQ
jgi:hypothetical protein